MTQFVTGMILLVGGIALTLNLIRSNRLAQSGGEWVRFDPVDESSPWK